jgi:hypothetical protein
LRGLRGVHHTPPHQAREPGGSELFIKARKVVSFLLLFFLLGIISKKLSDRFGGCFERDKN